MRLTIYTVCFFTIFIILVAAGAGICQVSYQPDKYWPMFHRSEPRDGYSAGVQTLNALKPVANRPSLGLIWTFPMPLGDFGSESRRTVDNSNWPQDAPFLPTPHWALSELSLPLGWTKTSPDDHYLDDYRWATGIDRGVEPTDSAYGEAFFPFPSSLPRGEYRVLVWFPTSPEPDPVDETKIAVNTTSAEYIIRASDRNYTVRVDQTVGGNWVEIDDVGFQFDPSRVGQGVVLTNRILDFVEGKPIVVCADAVRYIPSLNQAIYSSPAADLYAPKAHNSVAPSPFYESTWGPIGAAYIATVEKPRHAVQAGTSYGSIYCVNSDTVTRTGAEGLRWYAGRQIWQYPAQNPDDRGDLEGPIQGGIFGSPAISLFNRDSDQEFKRVYVSANDRQVYSLDAYTGKLVWKGPGATISEPALLDRWQTISGSIRPRGDTFGRSLLRTAVSLPPADPADNIPSVVWNMPNSELFNDGAGRAYAVYVWLPAAQENRVSDAHYEIDYDVDKTAKVTLDQNVGGAGRWARLGGSQGVYWNVSEVRLLNHTQRQSDVGRFAVADAIMIIPEKLEIFGYSNPVVSPLGGSHVYVGCSNGRVYALASQGNGDGTTREEWVYPNVRTANPATPTNTDKPPFGPVVASPAVRGGAMYVPSMDGRAYRLSPITGNGPTDANLVMFPDKDKDDKPVPATAGFSSSPAIDSSGDVYLASIDGRVFRTDANFSPIDPTQKWVFPGEGGVGAFRYSSPAVYGSVPDERIIIGSSDGRVYSLTRDLDPGWQMDMGDTTPQNTGQILTAPLQSSCAVDNSVIDMDGGNTGGKTVFAGTTDGKVWWLDAKTGRLPKWPGKRVGDYVFSSPAVAQFPNPMAGLDDYSYMYIGSDDGRLYAFSSTVNGGGWIGDDDGIPEPPDREDLTQPDAMSGVQAQIVRDDVYQAIMDDPDGSLGTNPLLNLVKDQKDFDEAYKGHTIGQSLRMTVGSSQEVIYEWGDKVHVVLWNLNKKADMEQVEIQIHSSSRTGDDANPASGGVEAGSNPQPGRIPPNRIVDYDAKGKDTDGEAIIDIKKGYATHVFNIPQSWMQQRNNRPPGAGSAWIINVSARVKGGQYRDAETGAIRTSGSVSVSGVVPQLPVTAGAKTYKPQYVSINNPLAIVDPKGTGLAWPAGNNYVNPSPTDQMARVNGNGASGRSVGTGVIPEIDMQQVNHGTNSALLQLGVLDRSKMGLINQALDRFKISGVDLYWRGGSNEVYNPLPWDWMPTESRGNDLQVFTGLTSSYVGSQMDYPDIRQRYQSFRKMSDGGNPIAGHTRLQAAVDVTTPGATTRSHRVIPDPVEIYVNVPRFQPANLSGYSAGTQAYLDMTGNQRFDDGNFVDGEPTAYIEPYRPFRLRLQVPPDYKLSVEESIIDLGKPPHGLGDMFPPSFAGRSWTPYDDPELYPWSRPWYSDFTVKNHGNVNLSNVQVQAWPLMSSQSGIPLLPDYVHSSLDDDYFGPLRDAADNRLPGTDDPAGVHNHTISKARVGDSEPTILTVPDRRRFQWSSFASDKFEKPKIGIQVPLTQPIGTYAQLVPISADVYGSTSSPGMARIYANPTFTLKATVRENRMTGGWTDGSLPQVDNPAMDWLISGNVQPAAFQDSSGRVHMFWASNRPEAKPDQDGSLLEPVRPQPHSPWYLLKTTLTYDSAKGWVPHSKSGRWWEIKYVDNDDERFLRLPTDDWPPDDGLLGKQVDGTIKHLSPSVAQDPDTKKTWLFWQGQVYRDAGGGRMNQENRVFYMDVTDGATDNDYYSFSRDFAMIKYSPRGLAYNEDSRDWLWAFYYGGDAGRWSIFYNVHNDGANQTEHNYKRWSRDARLTTPGSLASVSEPSAVRRQIGKDGAHYLDITYTGMSKESQNNDIYMSRYRVAGLEPDDVRLNPVPLPRARNEVMQLDAVRGTFSSRHIWWMMKPSPDSDWPVINAMLPLPDGTSRLVNLTDLTDPSGVVTAEVSEDKATGMYVIRYFNNSSNLGHQTRYDRVRQIIIDPSAGTIRFGKPLVEPKKTWVKISYTPRAMRISSTGRIELSSSDWTSYDEPENPTGVQLTTRWGGNADTDTSSYALLEKTPNTLFSIGGPGGGKAAGAPEVDRLWVFWRKPASGVRATTVFYKTYRLGVQLTKPVSATDLPLEQDNPSANGLSVSGNDGHFDVDWLKGRVYFTEYDERYPGLSGASIPIQVQYQSPNTSGSGGNTVTVTETFETVSWIPEMEEAALLGSASDSMVNEGQVCAFPQPYKLSDPVAGYPLGDTKTKMWVFWMSTRTGMADLFYETLSPVFRVYE